VAFIQLGVVMYGVVASYGLGQRLSDFPTDAINLLNDHAALFLAIPMIWITFVSFFNFRQPVARGGNYPQLSVMPRCAVHRVKSASAGNGFHLQSAGSTQHNHSWSRKCRS
jgi:hypothetical protein